MKYFIWILIAICFFCSGYRIDSMQKKITLLTKITEQDGKALDLITERIESLEARPENKMAGIADLYNKLGRLETPVKNNTQYRLFLDKVFSGMTYKERQLILNAAKREIK